MILCVTLNPCLDKTLTVLAWQPGDNVRGTGLREVVGGKGNNVARALKALGRPNVRPVTFLGGAVGDHCERLLRADDGLDPVAIPSAAATRVILTVRTQETDEQSAFFDPDPAVTQAEADALYAKVEELIGTGEVQGLTLSGSSPSQATHGLYSELISLANSRGIPVFLDTYGPALTSIWGFWPAVVQVNRREASQYLRVTELTDAHIIEMLKSWCKRGVALALVTNGAEDVLACHGGAIYRVTPPEIDVVNPIGSGDCLLAGLADAWLTGGQTVEAILRHGIACAAANAEVWDAGAITRQAVSELELAVVITAE